MTMVVPDRTTRYRVAVCGALLAVASCQGASGPTGIDLSKSEGDGVIGSWVHSGFYDRTYALHLPPETQEPAPLLIMLHGAGDTGAGFRARIAADEATDAAGFVVVYPDGIGGTWSVGCGCTTAELAGANDVIFLGTLIRHLAENLPVDTTRVYVAGYSQGGQLAQRYGCSSLSPPAGVASVAASAYRSIADGCAPSGSFPVLLIHGDADPVMRFDGFGSAANVLSATGTLDAWLRAFACGAPTGEETLADDNQDGTTVQVTDYGACREGARVRFDRVREGGHTWPGKTGPWPKSTGKHSRNLDGTGEILAVLTGSEPR